MSKVLSEEVIFNLGLRAKQTYARQERKEDHSRQ